MYLRCSPFLHLPSQDSVNGILIVLHCVKPEIDVLALLRYHYPANDADHIQGTWVYRLLIGFCDVTKHYCRRLRCSSFHHWSLLWYCTSSTVIVHHKGKLYEGVDAFCVVSVNNYVFVIRGQQMNSTNHNTTLSFTGQRAVLDVQYKPQYHIVVYWPTRCSRCTVQTTIPHCRLLANELF